MRMHWNKVALAGCLWVWSGLAWAQTIAWPARPAANPAALEAQVPALARQMLASYHDDDAERDLIARVRLTQMAGQDRAAIAAIQALRQWREQAGRGPAGTLMLQYEWYSQARLQGADSLVRVLREGFAGLSDVQAAQAMPVFGADLPRARRDLDDALERQLGQTRIETAQALELVRLYQFHQVYQALLPLMPAVQAEDEARRYIVQRDVVIPGAKGASLRGLIVRPRAATTPPPVLLGFTIYVNDAWSLADAMGAAAHGYVGAVVYSRGKAGSPGPITPYEYDGADAAAAIDWLSRQAWTDGRVGMYGNSYNSFTQWAAAKHRPPALKAMLTSASTAPGIDIPMQGGIFLNFLYPWPLWTATNATLNGALYGDNARWQKLDRDWYSSGRAYRDLPAIDGMANPMFSRWMQHPDYDAYWQAMTPQGREFADINIPVLAVTGYFDGARPGVQHYFDEHYRHNPKANHTLLIGPWGHFAMQAGVARRVDGYDVDPVAMIDLPGIRYAWFDHVLRGAAKPALLQDRVNYQVMGGDRWSHAPSIEAMATQRVRRYLGHAPADGSMMGVLAQAPSHSLVGSQLTVDLADRRDVQWEPAADTLTDTLDTHGGLLFEGEPLAQPMELSGLFSGQLEVTTNKRDVDLEISLYEKQPDGRYFLLSWHLGRASYAKDRRHRQLLTPGKPQRWEFTSERLVSRQLSAGSRLVLLVNVVKQRQMQINLGSGRDVSEETVADAGEPMTVHLSPSSSIELPLRTIN